MSRNSEFVPKVNVQPQDTIDSNEVAVVENYFYNMLDDYTAGGFLSKKCYSRIFIDRVIEHAQKLRGHNDVPKAIFNLINRSTGERTLWCTYDITEIPYLCNYYDFGSKADALACKNQLQQLKQIMSKKEHKSKLLMMNIERALSDVEDQLSRFDELSK